MRIPPVAVVLMAACSQRLLPASKNKISYSNRFAAVAVAGVSIGLIGAAVRSFLVAGTTLDPVCPERSDSLVNSGVLRLTRNPMYLGLAGLLTAHAFGQQSLLAMIPVGWFLTIMDRYQIPAEERALKNTFGQEYVDYTLRVPRWIGFPRQG